MTNLPTRAQAGDLDNIAVTRAEFRAEIGLFLEFAAQALGNVTGNYTNEVIDPASVVLRGTPTIDAAAVPAAGNDSTRIPSTSWVKDLAELTTPVGTVAFHMGNAAPTGWLECNGQSTASYPQLAAIVGATVPDLRGQFVRAWDNGAGVDSGRAVRTTQTDEFEQHNHGGVTGNAGGHNHSGSSSASAGGHSHTASTGGAGGHGHSVNDPGHAHAFNAARESGNTESGSGDTECFNRNLTTSSASTGISINAVGNHSHSVSVNAVGNHAHALTIAAIGNHNHSISNDGGASETRPVNFALMAIVKHDY